jgi:hypothetical protein
VRHWRGGTHEGRRGGHAKEVHTKDVEEERAPVGVWRGNDMVSI